MRVDAIGQRLQRRLGPNKVLWAVAHRMLLLIWKLLAQGIEYVERGSRALDPIRLAARMRGCNANSGCGESVV
jgi:hypothetical protein